MKTNNWQGDHTDILAKPNQWKIRWINQRWQARTAQGRHVMRRSFSCRRLHFWIVFSFCRRLNTYNMHTLHIMYIPWDRQLLNFANIESPQFGFRFHNRQVPSDQQTPEVIGSVYRNSAVLSNFRLDQEWTEEEPKVPLKTLFFPPEAIQ